MALNPFEVSKDAAMLFSKILCEMVTSVGIPIPTIGLKVTLELVAELSCRDCRVPNFVTKKSGMVLKLPTGEAGGTFLRGRGKMLSFGLRRFTFYP